MLMLTTHKKPSQYSDGFDMLLRGHFHLSYAQVYVGTARRGEGREGAAVEESLFKRGVIEWVWDVHFKEKGAFEPSFKLLAKVRVCLGV